MGDARAFAGEPEAFDVVELARCWGGGRQFPSHRSGPLCRWARSPASRPTSMARRQWWRMVGRPPMKTVPWRRYWQWPQWISPLGRRHTGGDANRLGHGVLLSGGQCPPAHRRRRRLMGCPGWTAGSACCAAVLDGRLQTACRPRRCKRVGSVRMRWCSVGGRRDTDRVGAGGEGSRLGLRGGGRSAGAGWWAPPWRLLPCSPMANLRRF